ncbi:MAG: ATP-binding protein [Halanaerobiales bacterium]
MQIDITDERQLNSLLKMTNRLLIYRNIIDEKIYIHYLALIDSIVQKDKEEILDNYFLLCSNLLEYNQEQSGSFPADPWQNFILNFILSDENILTQKIASKNITQKRTPLREALKQDLTALEKLFHLNLKSLADYICSRVIDSREMMFLPDWSQSEDDSWNYSRENFKKKMFTSSDWSEMTNELISYFQKNGTGILNSYQAFHWEQGLKGIKNIDSITLDQIVGYEKQKEKIIDNTEKLIKGYKANNILLYGARGTGKSSTVKAILNRYWDQGLRLIEVNKHQFRKFPDICDRLENSNLSFVIFIDDLSFTENETGYKELKATLEGKTKVLPANVVLYTTSNRKHLVKESYSDDSNELRKKDSVQEKLSLADRFGITLLYSSPTQKEYFAIVKHLAGQRKLKIAEKELLKKAKQWALWQNGRSGRTARQFIDNLEAELSLDK